MRKTILIEIVNENNEKSKTNEKLIVKQAKLSHNLLISKCSIIRHFYLC